MLVFDCPQCQAKLSAPESQAGVRVRCSKCKSVLTVPAPQGVAIAAAVDSADTAPAVTDRRKPVSTTAYTARDPATSAGAGFNRGLSGGLRSAGMNGFTGGGGVAGGGRRYGFSCAYCSSRLEATENMAAQEGQCPTCGSTITIPIQDRYGRLIDPKTRQIIKPAPHPVHAYAAAGERAPKIVRQSDGKQTIRCSRCNAGNPITANICKACGLPFTMEGTSVHATGSSNGFCVASLVLGVIGLATFCAIVPPLLAIVLGIIGLTQVPKESGPSSGRGLAIGGIVCGGVGCLLTLYLYVLRGWL